MGKTASTRDYLADIARSNAESSSGGGGGDSETFDFVEYATDLRNVSTIIIEQENSDPIELDVTQATWELDINDVPTATIDIDSSIDINISEGRIWLIYDKNQVQFYGTMFPQPFFYFTNNSDYLHWYDNKSEYIIETYRAGSPVSKILF